ncbi:MAG: DUF1801 domain-containing protein [Candidatus Kapabacteria bacterium]|nr:DUF1801 domain-containing protein [Candidatus Kapabacteria bacterium]
MSKEVDQYLSTLSDEERGTLQTLREQILAVHPALEEGLSRGVPFFYYRGKRAVGFRSSKEHLSFFIMEGTVLQRLHTVYSDFSSSSTVIRFSVLKPLPRSIVEQLVKARIDEIDESLVKKGSK